MKEKKEEEASELLTEAKGAQLRANIRWAEEGGLYSAYFLRQENVRGQWRLIRLIRRSDGAIVKSTKDILDVWEFYFRLFSSEHLEDQEQGAFLSSLEQNLSVAESELC